MSYGFQTPSYPRDAKLGFTPPPTKMRVEYGGLPFTTVSRFPASGFVMGVQSIRGWWESAPDTTHTVDSPTGDGLLALSPRLGARTVVLRGWVYAPGGIGELEAGFDQIGRARSGTLVVHEPAFARESDVRLAGVEFTRDANVWSKFVLTLIADDPLRYGTSVADLRNGRNVLLNPGDAVAYPIIDLVGPHSALTIEHPGGTFVFPALAAGWRRTIDCRNGDVWNAAGDRSFPSAMSGPWPRVGIGGAEWQVAGLGSGTVTVRRFQAWT